RRFLNRSKMAAAWKDCPSLDVIDALQIRARWLTLGNSLVGEDTKGRRRADVGAIDRIPAIVPIVTHRRGDGLRGPVQGERRAETVCGRRRVRPCLPLPPDICCESSGRVVQSKADGLRLGGLD